MDIGRRTLLWLGPTSYLVKLHAGPRARRVISVEDCPAALAGPQSVEIAGLSQWLTNRCTPGDEIDVVYQQHMLQVESFPPMGKGDLAGALRARLARDLIVPAEDLESHTTRVDTAQATQGVYCAVLAAFHVGVVRALQTAQVRMGRVAFAGQLAIHALATLWAGGGWTLLSDVVGSGPHVLAADPSGALLARELAADDQVRPEALAERIKVFLPRLEPGPAPCSLDPRKDPKLKSLGGHPLPAPLDVLLPPLFWDPALRKASSDDVEYPYVFAASTWACAAVVMLLLAYTGILGVELWDIWSVRVDVQRLDGEKKKLIAERKTAEDRLATLQYLQKHVRSVGAEVFDNGGWLTWLGQVRDRSAAPLLFDSISVEGAVVTLSGGHDSAGAVLGFASALAKAVGEEAARLQQMTRDERGKVRFQIRLRRDSSTPPELPEEEG